MRATSVEDKWAWVTGLVAVTLGLLAHIVAGGSAPAVPVILAFAALACLAAQLLARWINGPLLLLLVSGVAQQLLHMGFDAFGGYFAGSGLEHLHGGQPAPKTATEGIQAEGAAPAGDIHLLLYTHMAAAILTLVVAAGVSKAAKAERRTQRTSG
ncbi:hypothetical protein LFT48_02105 [Arthrobacter sp. FW305-123]|nr:hypothetical protein LFT48_02105 [Arthrobacter sp. FW305-123]